MRIVRLSVLVLLGSLALASSAAAQVTLYAGVGAGGSTGPLLSVDTVTGATTPIGANVGFGLTGLAEHPFTGVMYGTTTGSATRGLIIVNKTTGVGTLVGPTLIGPIPDISFRSDGTLFGWTESSDDLVTINPVTGAATVVGNSGFNTFGSGLAFNASNVLYFTGDGADGVLRTINPATGLGTTVATLTGAPLPNDAIAALAFHPVTGVLYGVNKVSDGPGTFLVTINVTTGVVSSVGALPSNVDALAFGVAGVAVPTMPGGLLLMLTAMLAAGAVFMMLRRNARLA